MSDYENNLPRIEAIEELLRLALARTGSGGGAATITVDTTALPGIGSGAYLDVGGFALPTDALSPFSAQFTGVMTAPNTLAVSGKITVNCTTQGGLPPNGSRLYLAQSTDDAGTGYGKFTPIAPPIAPILVDPTAFVGTPNGNISRVLRVVDNSKWATTKTVDAIIQTSPIEPSPVADQSFFGVQSQGFTPTDYFSASGTSGSSATDMGAGRSVIVLFDVNKLYTGLGGILNNQDAGFSKGWGFGASTDIQLFNNASGNHVDLGPPKAGLNCAAISNDGTNLFGALNGGLKASTATGAYTPVDGTCTLHIGANPGLNAWNGGIIAFAFFNRVLTWDDIMNWTGQQIFPVPPKNRYQFPIELLRDPALLASWSANDLLTVLGPGFQQAEHGIPGPTLFTLTQTGAPTTLKRSEEWKRNIANALIDTVPPVLNSQGVPQGNELSRLSFTAPAAQQDIYIEVWNNDPQNSDNDGTCFVVDGTTWFTFPTNGDPTPDGITRGYWQTIALDTADAATHTVQIINPPHFQMVDQAESFFPGGGINEQGGFIVSLVAGLNQVFDTDTCTKRLVLSGDDGLSGQDVTGAGGLPKQEFSLTTLIRAVFPTGGGVGRVTAEGAVARALFDMYFSGSNSVLPYARKVVDLVQKGSPVSKRVYHALGWRDYTNNSWTPAAFATQYQALINAIAVLDPTIVQFAQLAYQTQFYTLPNAGGHTLAAYNAQISALTGCHVVDPTTPHALVFQGVLPQSVLTAAGISALEQNIQANVSAPLA